jgi:ABC-2 type transport system ATP-binding protein
MSELSIRVAGVSVRYRLSREKPKTLQEFLIQKLKGRKTDYEDFWALKDVNFEVGKGETLGIIGANGAGKSTLLKVVARVLKPITGSVFVSGKIAPLIELGAGFDMELTGSENIYLNASILGLSKKEIDNKFKAIVDFSELSGFIYSPLKTYSSGMIARLGFSIATEVDPAVLIIDEILAVGDEHFKKKCKERISRFREKGVTMLFVSHTMEDVRKLCNSVLWMHRGSPRMCGDPQEVTREYLKITS